MFKSKTVFVIGAGASKEAGLPTGEELKKSISALLNFNQNPFGQLEGGCPDIRNAIESAAGPNLGMRNEYYRLAKQISEILPSAASIDNYLDAHSENEVLKKCGKMAIVKAILDAESISKLKNMRDPQDRFNTNDLTDTWYVSLLRLLVENVTKENIDSIFENVSFISFNYDRCLERYLRQAITDYYGLLPEDTNSAFKKLRIYHPYGVIGPLPWQTTNGAVVYGDIGRHSLITLSENIRTFTESVDDDTVKQLRAEVADAQTLIFLGFAYHDQNLKLIMPDMPCAINQIYGTSLGISSHNMAVINSQIMQMFSRRQYVTDLRQYHAASRCQDFFSIFARGIAAGSIPDLPHSGQYA
jgi:hypothetical protein